MKELMAWKVKSNPLPGSNYKETILYAQRYWKESIQKTKRHEHVKSMYFKKEKIFLKFFWIHLHQKMTWRYKAQRVKLLPCALELITHSTFQPISVIRNRNKKSELLIDFGGFAQIKLNFMFKLKKIQNIKNFLCQFFPNKKPSA